MRFVRERERSLARILTQIIILEISGYFPGNPIISISQRLRARVLTKTGIRRLLLAA